LQCSGLDDASQYRVGCQCRQRRHAHVNAGAGGQYRSAVHRHLAVIGGRQHFGAEAGIGRLHVVAIDSEWRVGLDCQRAVIVQAVSGSDGIGGIEGATPGDIEGTDVERVLRAEVAVDIDHGTHTLNRAGYPCRIAVEVQHAVRQFYRTIQNAAVIDNDRWWRIVVEEDRGRIIDDLDRIQAGQGAGVDNLAADAAGLDKQCRSAWCIDGTGVDDVALDG